MLLTPSRTSTRRAAVVAACAAVVLPVTLTASPALAAGTDRSAATRAIAVNLELNLPGGASTKIALSVDPVTGAVRTVSGTAPQAAALASVLAGTLGGQTQDLGRSEARLPGPLAATDDPTAAFNDGIAGSPLANLLKVQLTPSSAAVTVAPSSTSQAAVTNLGVGLPDALADALAPLTDGLAAAVDQALQAIADGLQVPVAELCAGLGQTVGALSPVTDGLDGVLGTAGVPVTTSTLLGDTLVGGLCALSDTIGEIDTALQAALGSLTGDSGVLGLAGVTASQTITSAAEGTATRTTATSTSQVAGLTLLGQQALASAQVLQSVSTASTAGTAGSATASVDSTIAALKSGEVDPFASARATLQGIQADVAGLVLPDGLETALGTLFDQLFAALAPAGLQVVQLDDPAGLKTCPTALDGSQSGTFTAADGSCAAAAVRGVGLQLTLPEALATPLGVAGPLVLLQIVPSAAAVTEAPLAVPGTSTDQLPRTGTSAVVGGVGLACLVGAALLRRRRTA